MSEANQTPEQRARDRIDSMLVKAGWRVQDKNRIDFNKGPGIAVREYPTDRGPAEYVLFIERNIIGVIEAKRPEMGQHLNVATEQTARYVAAERLKRIQAERDKAPQADTKKTKKVKRQRK